MQFKIDKNIFIKSLSHIQGVVERRNTVPILSNVKITASDNNVELTATDMNISLTENLEAEVSESGCITVPAHTFCDIIRKFPDSSIITISYQETEGGKLEITSNKCDFSLPVIAANNFPIIESGDITHSFTISRVNLLKLFDKAKFAISTEETRYYLNGIFLHDTINEDSEEVLRAVATDGHRLARIEVDLPEGAKDMPKIIIPRKTIFEAKKILDESDKTDVTISISDNKIKIEHDNSVLLSKLIDGSFPDYEKVIPTGNSHILKTEIKSFTDAIDRVSIIDKGRSIKLIVDNDKLLLSANNVESGRSQEELEVSYKGNRIESGFNSRYVMELTSVLEGNTMELCFSTGSAPTLVKDNTDADSLFVIMPIRM